MRRTRILILVGFGAFVFLGISLMLARALSATGTERSKVLEIVEAQARGDAKAVLDRTPACAREPACVASTEAFVAKLRRPGDDRDPPVPPVGADAADARGRHRPRRLARGRRRASRSSSASACAATVR